VLERKDLGRSETGVSNGFARQAQGFRSFDGLKPHPTLCSWPLTPPRHAATPAAGRRTGIWWRGCWRSVGRSASFVGRAEQRRRGQGLWWCDRGCVMRFDEGQGWLGVRMCQA